MASTLKLSYVTLTFTQSATQKADLAQLLADQQNPDSPNYHHWLTPEQYADRFGVSPDDIVKITSWLQSQGLTIANVARGRNWIAVNGSAAQIESAFQTEIHRYQVNGERHFANATEPSVPAALGAVVMSIRGLNDFRMKPLLTKPRYNSQFLCGGNCLAPDDLAKIYDITPAYNQTKPIDGTGQTIAVAGQTDIIVSDITTFRSTYGLPAINLQQILIPSSTDPGVSSGDLPEADLDLEWSGAVARNATILYVYATDVMTAVQYAIDRNLAPVVSTSYGSCELETASSDMLAFQNWAEQGNSMGITWFNASGDSGGADCSNPQGHTAHPGLAVDTPASVPQVVAVGGTEFAEGSGTYWSATNNPTTGSSALSYIPETTWNDSFNDGSPSASGGGVSTATNSSGVPLFPKPAWQTGPGTFLSSGRNVPDVSMTASADHDGYLVYTGGQLQVYGGTSVSAQVFAGIGALMNQYLVSSGKQSAPGMGNLNAELYPLAQKTPGIFHDITTGNNIVTSQGCSGRANTNCVPVGYNAGPGYDPVTGLGSVDVWNLIVGSTGGTVVVPAITISTLSLPAGATGTAYSQTLTATGGVAPYTWTLSGSLPPGLTLTPATGLIGGTPTTAAGSPFIFSVTAADSTGKSSAAQNLSIAITGSSAPAPVITSLSPSSAPAGSPTVTVTITGSGFTGSAGARWNGLSLSTNVASSTTLTAQIPAGDLINQGTGQITVANATGSASNSLPFVITSNSSLQFLTVAPCRIMDTRNPTPAFPGSYIAAGTVRTIPIPSSTCGIPVNASAYSLNFTVVPKGALNYLSVWPAGQTQPLVSTLNSLDGSAIANAAIVPAGAAGAIDAYASSDTDLVVDINGYFVPRTAGTLQFYPLAPCRILDTRTLAGGPITGGTSRSFAISGSCATPATAAAYAFNVTVVPPGALSYLTAWPTGQAQPVVSTLNSFDGTTLANAAIVAAGTAGDVSFYASDTTDLVVDINGYFAPPASGGLNFYPVTPCRLADTRNGMGGSTMAANTTRSFALAGSCGLPGTPASQAYSLNITVIPLNGAPLGYLSTWPAAEAQPSVSTLNAYNGQIVANAAIVPSGAGGSIDVYVTNPTDVVIDTNGYFGP